MSTPKQLLVSKRKLFLALISIALICSLASGSIMYVVAQGGSTPITISSGIYPGAPNHTIWVDSGTYYDKTSYGVTTSSINAATIINQAIINTPTLGTVILNGNITITSTIQITHPINFYFDQLIIGATSTTNGIEIVDLNKWDVGTGTVIKGNNLVVNAPHATWNKTAILLQNSYAVTIDIKSLTYDVTNTQSGIGIEVFADNGEGIMGCTIQNIQMLNYFLTNIYIHTEGTGYINRNSFNNIFSGQSQYCLKIYDNGNGIGSNTFFDYVANIPLLMSNHATACYGIWIEGNVAADWGYVDRATFYNYVCYDADAVSSNPIVYHANNNVRWTSFIGGQLIHTYWDDNGIATQRTNTVGAAAGAKGIYTPYQISNSGWGDISSSTSVVISHGLGAAPTCIQVTFSGTWSQGAYAVVSVNADNFTVAVANSGTYGFYWYASFDYLF
jgi:hypothetical protein